MSEEYKDIAEEAEDKKMSAKAKAIIISVIIVVVLGIAVITNPSEKKHEAKIDSIVNKFTQRSNRMVKFEAPDSFNDIEYHSLGVMAWTTVQDKKKGQETLTIGAFGIVHPLFEMGI